MLPNPTIIWYTALQKVSLDGEGNPWGRFPFCRFAAEAGSHPAGRAGHDYIKGGVPMSFEAISNITQAEAEARAMVAGAEQRARQLAADAENAGKLAVEAAAAKAAEELAELSRQVDDKARAQAEAYAAELENKKAALRAKAGGKLDQAAALVVERIVNS